MQTNIDVDAILHKITLSPQCSRPEGVELTHSCTPSAAASTPRPARADVQRPSVQDLCVDDAKRSLTLLHLAARIYSSKSIVLKASFSCPAPLALEAAGWKNRSRTYPFRAAAGASLPPALVVSLAGYVPRSPHGSLPVLTAVFWAHSVQMPLIWSPLSQHQHHSAVIYQPGGNVGCQPIRCRDSQKSANHRHALAPSDRQRG